METYIRLTKDAEQLLECSKISVRGVSGDGAYLLRHSEDIHFKENHEYNYKSLCAKLGIKAPSKKLLAKWADMTDANEHPGVRYEIAKWANVPNSYKTYRGEWRGELYRFEDMFKAMDLQLQRGQGYDLKTECFITDQMFVAIAREYGRDIAGMIEECL